MFFRDVDFLVQVRSSSSKFVQVQFDVLGLGLAMFKTCFGFCCLKSMLYSFNMHVMKQLNRYER